MHGEEKTHLKGLTHEIAFAAVSVGEIFESIVHSVFEIPLGYVN